MSEKLKAYSSFLGLACMLLLLHFGCKPQLSNDMPLLKTLPATNLTANSLTIGGQISSDGGAPVIARGVCWSTKVNPTILNKDSLTTDGTGIGSFTSIVAKLKPGIAYYFKAYATNSVGTAYGNLIAVNMAPVVPSLTTLAVTALTDKIVNSGGTITSDGGAPVFARGVCWSTSQNPTTANSYTSEGIGIGIFISSVTKLYTDSVYYLRAYATNSEGTAYGNTRSFSISGLIVLDKDGNYYHSATIGAQVWLTENLKTTRFSDSTAIPLVENGSPWSNLITPAYSWYDNDRIVGKNTYGGLYNWYAVTSGKLCPSGWHVPTDAEWTTLTDYLGGLPVAGGKLKEVSTDHWSIPNSGATNETLFTALPGGSRSNVGLFDNAGTYGNWWSSTASSSSIAYYRYIYYGNSAVTRSFINQKYGLSVRCIKN